MPTSLHVIIPAAGIGQRMQHHRPKQYLPLAGSTVLECTLQRLRQALPDTLLHVMLHPEDRGWANTDCAEDPTIVPVTGGASRAESVRLGLAALAPLAGADDWVLVHDVARPCVTVADIHRLLVMLAEHPVGGLLATPVTDTLKQVGDGHLVTATVDRSRLWRALTPQMFRYGLLSQALEQGAQLGWQVTDEASALEQAGHHPLVVPGRGDNLKVTLPEDLALAHWLLSRQNSSSNDHLPQTQE
ncbi:MAG: 2-C-methyl-D-erythritol 4-phosphate cytidylyltransferase [Halomonadaceae bacterium]|nr:MAG: 2-C-methyl-D-erythritol 4-phosphate cytidylyltransferase [Halomonadaceae bacterium]